MSVIYYDLYVTDSTVTSGSPGATGLMPAFTSLLTVGASHGGNVASFATAPTEIGKGHYQIAYDPEENGEAAGEVDCGASLAVNTDRFLPVFLTRDSSRIANSLTAAGGASLNLAGTLVAPRVLDAVGDTLLTLNDALHCAVSGSAGKEAVVGTAYRTKTPTGTVLRNFVLDSPTAPTQRD